jgi:hypothetical protein
MKHLKTYEKYIIGEEPVDIKTSIKYLKKLPKELKDAASDLVKQYSTAKNGKVTGLELHPDLVDKIEDGGYPDGFDMGVDKDGYFVHTHRARSKSYDKPDGIPVKDLKFIDSTG